MLPVITNQKDNAANLNAAFVTDNSLEQNEETGDVNGDSGSVNVNGNSEAEINKLNYMNGEMEDHGETVPTTTEALVEDVDVGDDAIAAATDAVSSLVASEPLTIEYAENNEESEVNGDNFNESSTEDGATITTAANEDDLAKVSDATTLIVPTDAEEDDLRAELDEDEDDDDENVDNTALQSEDGNTAQRNKNNEKSIVNSSETHSNYAANNHREDVSSSSDDEADEKVEMPAQFNSEWENLAEDLANVNDEDNDLNNDIDVYETVPVDLSNDIAVNDIAAAQSDFPRNPDAEVFEVDDLMMSPSGNSGFSSVPKFEKLSVASAINPTSYQPTSHFRNLK